MSLLLDRQFPRALDGLVARFSDGAYRGHRVDAWLFEDAQALREAERALAAHGVTARLRPAYKPLLHAVLDEIALTGATAITIHTPSHPSGSAERFRLEAYPLAALLGSTQLYFQPGTAALDYAVTVLTHDSSTEHRVFAPNHVITDHLGEPALVPTGWLRVWPPGDADPSEDGPLETEYQAAFAAIMAAIAAHPWGTVAPYFETLEIRVDTGGIERPLPWQDECLSTREALHEDLYFSILELFQRHSGLPPGDRTLRPGQIVPDIRPRSGATHVTLTLGPHTPHPIPDDAAGPLATADRPLTPARIAAELASLGGELFSARTVQGREALGSYFPGSAPGLLISAGQHANEASGVIGALRAARILLDAGQAGFALIPQENPDGYALHHRLRDIHPRHMHHAARYTALGDDLEFRASAPLHEKALRLTAQRLLVEQGGNADLHINLHGYPAHEWTRPLTGYVPRRFELWTVPKGFFLIMRHPPGDHARAERFVIALTERLAENADLRALNEAHIAAYLAHAGELPYPLHHGIPCMITEARNRLVPFTLITEYPDETIYGPALELAHTTQMQTVLAAAALWRKGYA
jgi:hypothetical protein